MKKLIPERGFTIIELLVVIAIIGILTAIVTGNFTGAKAKARDSKRVSDLSHIQLALSLFFDRCNRYPIRNGILPSLTDSCGNVRFDNFISHIPVPPTNVQGYGYEYYVDNSGTPTDYVLRTGLELNSPAILDGAYKNNVPFGAETILCSSANAPYLYCLRP